MKDFLIQSILEMNEEECQMVSVYFPKRFFMSEKQKKCNHNYKYDYKTGGLKCIKCRWMP